MEKSRNMKLVLLAIAVVAAVLIVVVVNRTLSSTGADEQSRIAENAAVIPVTEDSDLVIPISDITDQASFYPVVIDNTEMEVIAVKTDDGVVRTAFNTCQVCYDSGKGYYEQEGDELVCNNCGNRFQMTQVEETQGGCNPVPISAEYKTVDDQNITISKDYLQAATQIFQEWKTTA